MPRNRSEKELSCPNLRAYLAACDEFIQTGIRHSGFGALWEDLSRFDRDDILDSCGNPADLLQGERKAWRRKVVAHIRSRHAAQS